MKNQYVGDVNDYFKYAYLRCIQDQVDSHLTICWMATAGDNRRDGRRRGYLTQPEKFRDADPGLFDELRCICAENRLGITAIEESSILSGARFFSPLLEDTQEERDAYFRQLWQLLRRESLVFFDPDNGLEVKSVPKGRRGSSKYLYLDELQRAAEQQRSVIVYQHFGRVERRSYVATQLRRITEVAPAHDAFAVSGTHIAFLVSSPPGHSTPLRSAAQALCGRWPGLTVADRS